MKSRLLASSVFAGAAFMAQASMLAIAQEADESVDTVAPAAEEDATARQQTVYVTGSRIASPNLTTTSPVSSVSSEDIKLQGTTRVEDLVVQLPQAFASQNSTVANGASGTATVSLRNLGSTRTLVLIDGKRMPYGSPNDAAADLNLIPSQLVERVDVLTGGASAVYGSDAVSGVVNFIMKNDFEGVQVDTQYGFFQHNNDYDTNGNLLNSTNGAGGLAQRAAATPEQFQVPGDAMDGISKEITAIMGVNTDDGRGNLTAWIGYRNNDEVLQRYRDYSACSIDTGSGAMASYAAGADFRCGGSATTNPAYITDFVSYDYTLDAANPGEFRDYTGADAYNFGPLNYYQRPDQRYSVGFNGHYEINDYVEAYGQFQFMDYESVAQIAPSGTFFNTSTIACDNAMLSASQRDALCAVDLVPDIVDDPDTAEDEVAEFIGTFADPALGQAWVNATLGMQNAMTGSSPFIDDPDPFVDGDETLGSTPYNGLAPFYIGRRNVEGGGRRDILGYQTYRGVIGLRGDLYNASGWTYDVSAQYSQVSLTRTYTNEFSIARMTQALDAIEDPDTGELVCRDPSNGCVPYDIFSFGGVTQEALDFIQVPLLQNGTTEQTVVTGVISGDLGQYGFQLPSAESGLKVALGAEYRRDALESITDNSFASGDGSGQGGPTIGLSGAIDSYEAFGEFQLPLIEGRPGVELLSLEGAYRYSDYSTGSSSDAFKIGGDYAPTSDIRFRASFQRAVRAPNVIELFQAQGFNLFDLDNDPCGPNPTATLEQCIATGVPATNYGGSGLDSPAGQYNFQQGGNLDLEPEEADTYTIGFVATPSFLPGASLSVDYYSIEITNLISTYGSENTLSLCYDDSDAAACSRIHRNENGQLWVGTGYVEDLNVNIGGLEASGVDVAAAYGFDMGTLGSMNLALNGTWAESFEIDTIGIPSAVFDCVGYYASSCTNSAPTGTPIPEWRHRARASWATPIDGLDLSATWRYIGEVELYNGDPDRVDYKLDAQNYFDLAGQWAAKDWVAFRFGVNNVLDEDPPLSASVGTTGNGNTYPQLYDAMGRYVFVGATFDF